MFTALQPAGSRRWRAALYLAAAAAIPVPAFAQAPPPFAIDISREALTGLWWKQDEPGWGMALTQQRSTIFVTWYSYGEAGNPTWYAMSSCAVAGNACEGEIYRVRGGTPLTVPWNGAGRVVTTVGRGRLEFSDENTGAFSFTVDGRAARREIARQVFAPPGATTAYSGLWWNAAEPGWGIAVTRQGDIVFATTYSYDSSGEPVWHAAPRCVLAGSACSGELYRVTGGSAPWLAWAGSDRVVSQVGTLGLAFSGAEEATLSYTIDGLPGTKPLTRQRFGTAPPSIQLPASVPACPASTATPLLGTSPVALADFIAFRPLGFLSPPIHMFPAKHSAFSMTPPGRAPVRRPVVAPGRLVVTEIYEASFSSGGRNYQVFVHPCRDVRIYFGHLAAIAPRLAAAFAAQPPACNSFADGTGTVTTCRRTGLDVALEEGEVLGEGPDTAGVDFGLLDFRRSPAGFIRLDHYDAYYPYYASPLEYFSPAARSALEAKTGDVLGTRMRTAAPIGGTYAVDLAGRARGNWFLPGRYHSNSTDLSAFLGLAHDYVDPSFPLLAVGTSVAGMAMGLYSYRVEAAGLTNRDSAAIGPDGNIHCIDGFVSGRSPGSMPLATPPGVLLLAMPSNETLTVELRAASSCSALGTRAFSARATTFER